MTNRLPLFVLATVLTTLSGTAFAQEAAPDPEGGGEPAPAPVQGAAAGVGPAASAGAAAQRGAIELGLRVGYAVPFGKEGRTASDASDTKLSDDIKGVLPIEIDAGYRINPQVYVGLSFQYGFGFLNTSANPECGQSGVSCSTSDLRLGVNAQLHLSPGESFDPWLGLGVGYEWLSLDVSASGANASVTGSGFEFANVQVGGDLVAARNLVVGPFIGLSLGEYRSVSTSGAAGSGSQDITSKSLHEWLEFGVRGAFDIDL
jgi:opacity protein-like surface antigen